MYRCLLLSLALFGFAPFASAASSPPAELTGLPHVSFPAPHRVASGRLQASDIPALKHAGIREVIDLSVDSETPDFDEAAAMHAAGIDYRNLPIHGADDLSPATVTHFDRLLAEAGDRETLVHCASSNRVGALIALRAALIGGKNSEDAVAEGRRWGLKSLEPVVRARLSAWQSADTSAAPAPPTR
ncbi:sulfur transferase domain-containing protein [Rhodanobacter sp. AS-Z3]|uniref:beta-lactamase hydrolase domain-containing protein n=1 Tax=Rhodanobacter sp. AS-Z3 TaxID=3031330 RepID=UPI00247B0975|nr:sulfur transferase domain-containing protein [Rhodanobacter sp. AS-Z3]WEN14209.1 sulfur transferase domain-containing protein [Rhodanobacter sp. AS-Z3]